MDFDEFSLLQDNAAEVGLPWRGAPRVERRDLTLPDGRTLSSLVWGAAASAPGAASAPAAPGAAIAPAAPGAASAPAAPGAASAPAAPGADPEIVFLHGGAQNVHTWDTVILALDRPALAVDLPGHGRSSWKDDGLYPIDQSADDVAVAISALAPRASLVVGMSLGGITSIALAARHPALVRKLLLVDVTPGVNSEKAAAVVAFVSGPPTFESFQSLLDRTIEHNPTRTESSLRRGILHNALELEDGSWAWRHHVGRGGVKRPEGADFAGLWDLISASTAPLMLVRGGISPVVDDEDVAELRRRRPDVRVEVVADAGHSIQGDKPLELAALIQSFM